MKKSCFISFIFAASLGMYIDASETIRKKILKERRFLLYNSKSHEGKCLSICNQPTPKPTSLPTPSLDKPTPVTPTGGKMTDPTRSPSTTQTSRPTGLSSIMRSSYPTKRPTQSPTMVPTSSPTSLPPTLEPTANPTKLPTNGPTDVPTRSPTVHPTSQPTLKVNPQPTHECVWPEEKFSAITKGDLISGAHSAYHQIAVGGKLVNPSNSQMAIDDKVYGSSWKGKFNFNSGVEKINNLNDVPAIDYDHYEWLARNMKSSDINGKMVIAKNTGTDGSQNGCYDLYDFRSGGQGYDNGNTLVVFNTTDDICLTKTRDGRQFGPSVLAPFSKVTLTHAGFIDGTVIAREFTTVDGSYKGTELQLHGITYNGPIECIETSSPVSADEPKIAPKEKDGECNCEAGDNSDQTFRCGNNIYVCPNVEKVCSTQGRAKSKYYSLTQEECDVMKNVGIGEKCISLPQYGVKKGKTLGNRACYSNREDNGMSNDGNNCKFCKDSITPIFKN